MTPKDFLNNMLLGFTTKEEGFSIKKQVFVLIVVTMLIATFFYTDDNNWLLVLTAWLAFATSLIVTGAVEKNITAVNETKQLKDEKSN